MVETTKTRHTCNDGRGPSFGRKAAGCPRCDELLADADCNTQHTCGGPRWGNLTPGCPRCDELASGFLPVETRQRRAEREDAERCAEIRAHDCSASGCGRVCTFGQW